MTHKDPDSFQNSKPHQSTAMAASKRHSFRVQALRKALPIVVGIIILLVLTWTSIDLFFEEKIEGLNDIKTNLEFENKVANPTLKTTDKDGNPVIVKAESGTHSQNNIADFEKPCCELDRSDGKKVKLSADTGRLDQAKKVFIYRGNVVVQTHTKNNEEIILKTKSAKVLLDQQDVEGDDEIQGQTPMGSLTAKHGFRFDHKKQTVFFKGPVDLVITPKPKPEKSKSKKAE